MRKPTIPKGHPNECIHHHYEWKSYCDKLEAALKLARKLLEPRYDQPATSINKWEESRDAWLAEIGKLMEGEE